MGGGIVLLLMDRIFNLVKLFQPKGGQQDIPNMVEFNKMKSQIHDLHMWHDKDDGDGVKIWYVRKSLEDNMKNLADTLGVLTTVMTSIQDTHEKILDELQRSHKDHASNGKG